MKSFFSFLLVLITLTTNCNAQTRTAGIPHTYAFFYVAVPGAQQADENGNPINRFIINRFLYIETTGKQPLIINSITSQGKKYKFTVEMETANPVEAGNNYTTNMPVKIKAAKANRLWKVSYTPVSGKDITSPIKNIVIRGKAAGKTFKLGLPKDIQLAGPLLY
jgi:hypothetical protein